MNQRIKQFADEASLYAVSDNSSMLFDVWKKRYTEKFAELIVEECIVILNREIDEEESKEKNRTISDMMDLLEQHFGVENENY